MWVKRKVLLAILILSLTLPTTSANSVETGKDATGNSFVVPVYTYRNANATVLCSGALIAPLVVVTAAHCILDSKGLVSKNVFIGEAGGNSSTAMQGINRASEIHMYSSFTGGAGNTLGANDIAFLTLTYPIAMKSEVFFPTENLLSKMKSSHTALEVIGYGSVSDNSQATSSTPNSYQGIYSDAAVLTNYPNSGVMVSKIGNSCGGDSGAPVLAIYKSRVTIIGVLTGSVRNMNCTKKLQDGTYLTYFSLVGKFPNLAFAAAVEAMNSQNAEHTQIKVDAKAQVDLLNSEIQKISQNHGVEVTALEKLTKEFNDLNSRLASCLAGAKKIISTKKGKLPTYC
jgi:V8-like Glu-specific endopeptidase